MKTPTSILTARQEALQKQREYVQQLEANRITASVQLAKLDSAIAKEQAKLIEMGDSITFMTGLLSALNESYDKDIEEATQEGFKQGYNSHKKELKNPKKPLPNKAAIRKKRIK